jgi:protein required for attachment to host cells
VTADTRNATLFACERLPSGDLHLKEQCRLPNTHEAEHERERPTLTGGAERRGSLARSGAHAAPHAIAPGRTADEERQRFAREVGAWVNAARKQHAGDRVAVMAPPRFLGFLREHAGFGDAVEMHSHELAQLTAPELARHPAVLRAVAGR